MPRIDLPDGRSVDFPDGMSPGDMQKALDQMDKAKGASARSAVAAPAPVTTTPAGPPGLAPGGRILQPLRTGIPAAARPADVPLRVPKMLGSAAVHGLAEGLGLPGDMEALARRVYPKGSGDVIAPAVGAVTGALAPVLGGPIGAAAATLAPTPADTGELPRGVPLPPSMGSTASGPTLPLGGPPPATGQLLPTSADTTGLTRQLGLTDRPELAPRNLGERLGSAAAEGLGSMLPFSGIAHLASPKNWADATKIVQKALPTLAAGTAGGSAGQGTEELVGPGHPWVDALAGAFAGMKVGGLASWLTKHSIESIAGQLGQSRTLQEAGTALQQQAKDWSTGLRGRIAPMWAPVDAAIAPNTQVSLKNFTARLYDMVGSAGSLQSVVDKLTSSLPKALYAGMMNPSTGMIFKTNQWKNVQQLRSAIGEAFSDHQIVKDITPAKLSSLYQALSEDMRKAAKSKGVLDEFNSANDGSKKLYDFSSNIVQDVLDKDPEKIAQTLLASGKVGGTKLEAIREHMPESADELAAAHLRQPNVPWAKTSPEAKAALVEDPAQRTALDRLVPATAGAAKLDHGTNLVSSLLFGDIGKTVGLNALGLLGVPAHVGEMIGQVAGAGLPMAARGAANLIRNPGKLKLPLAGALGTEPWAGQEDLTVRGPGGPAIAGP